MKKKEEAAEKAPRFEITECPGFRPIYASGVFGGLDPNDGRIIFFLDRIRPKMKGKPSGGMELDGINRELQVEVHMTPPQFMSVAKWMSEHADRFREMARQRKAGKKAEATKASYIG